MDYYLADQVKPVHQQYVHSVCAGNGLTMIITMHPCLAKRLHNKIYSLHDNTYQRVHGVWKEWEATCWDAKLNRHM